MLGVEIGKLYRLMRRGDLDTIEGVRMTQVLLGLKQCLEYSDIEQRMLALEAALTTSRPTTAIQTCCLMYRYEADCSAIFAAPKTRVSAC